MRQSITTGPRVPRAELDPKAERYHVYHLIGADGRILYIGRSCDPVQRLRSHHRSGAEWPALVVEMRGHGPYTWGEAVKLEREAILRERPPYNIDGVARNNNRTIDLGVAS